jgi:membrane dipeptidase
MPLTTRRKFLLGTASTLLASAAAGWYYFNKKPPLGMEVDEDTLEVGRQFLNKIISADVHAHPGRSFVKNAHNLSGKINLYAAMGSFEDETITDLVAGGFTLASFATVADFQLLGLKESGGLKAVREFNPGEAWQSYQIQLASLQQVLKDDRVTLVLKPDDVIEAKKNNKVAAFFTSEGADFLEGSLERLEECYQDGMRSLTLVHYHINEIGDIQTAPPRYKTLTPFGINLVKQMNNKGMLIDLAHAARGTSLKAMEVTQKPVMISHTAIRREGFDNARFIGMDEAKMAASTGGIIGAWPAGFGLLTLADYIDQIFHLVDEIGIDHVALGTDMDANYKPVFYSYKQGPLLAGTLLKRGMSKTEAAKILGGNFMRVFREVSVN